MTQINKAYVNKDHKGNSLLNVGKVSLVSDAVSPEDAVRKSQAETIASNTTQAAIVNSLAIPNATST
jgi:hypothetical protein